MKKLVLSSLVAVLSVSSAQAVNLIDGNPLYMPKENHFYSVTDLGSRSKHTDAWTLNEKVGYGVTDKFDVSVSTTVKDEQSFDKWSWRDLTLTADWRVLTKNFWKLDLVGSYSVEPIWGYQKEFLVAGDYRENTGTEYTWRAGFRGGYTNHNFTFAGHALLKYWNTRSFNWDEEWRWGHGKHWIVLGLDAQFVFDKHWNVVAGAEYTGSLDGSYRGRPVYWQPTATGGYWANKIHNAGTWTGTFGINYNINPTKYVGAYVGGNMRHRSWNGEWYFQDGVLFGAKFGTEF